MLKMTYLEIQSDARPGVPVQSETSVDQEVEIVYAPDDVIAGILGLMEGDRFSANPRCIHEAIDALREKHSLLEGFVFAKGDFFSYSPLLERVLDRLRLSRLLTINETGFLYGLQGRTYIESKILSRFNEEERKALGEMAEKFEEMCGVEEE